MEEYKTIDLKMLIISIDAIYFIFITKHAHIYIYIYLNKFETIMSLSRFACWVFLIGGDFSAESWVM